MSTLSGPRCLLFAVLLAEMPSHVLAQAAAQPTPTPLPSSSGPARTQENVVRQAEDGFGATIGRESIGIYSPGNVRGFSALAAGNARINGLFFDQVAAPSPRVRRSTAIRVGLSGLTFPFPAPTGVVDYTLIRAASEASLSVTASGDTYENGSLELDFALPVAGDTLALAGGGAVLNNDFVNGATSTQRVLGVSTLIRPVPDVEIQPFWTRTDTYNNKLGPAYAPGGDFLPPDVPKRRFFGQEWSQFEGAALLYGVVASGRLSEGWTVDAGLFRSVFLTHRDSFVLLDDIQTDGTGTYLVFTDPPGKTASTSGELRISHVLAEGSRIHRLIASARGRDRSQLSGGSDVQNYGHVAIGNTPVFPEPHFVFGEQSRDRVRQFSGGFAYALRWEGRGEVSLGLSRTDYSKSVVRPGASETETHSAPWLYNSALALYLTDHLALYAGYARGLEESGVAPQNASNRNEALPAILTSQRDAGFRWSLAKRLKLIAGVFDLRKPYFTRDASGLFAQLGDIRNRGIEMSLSGTLTDRLRAVVGVVLLDPLVTGEGVELGRVGPRPVGLPRRKFDFNLDWSTPVEGVSLDLRAAHQSSRPSVTLNQVYLPERTLIDVGGRYRFSTAGKVATLRMSLGNVLDATGYDVFGSGTYDIIDGRTFRTYLVIDF